VSNQKLALVSTLEIASVGLGVVVRSYLEKSAARYAVNPRNFFGELTRRNVYKVAIAYTVAWLLMQAASQLFPFFEIPNWAVRLVVVLLIMGFPVALILAWAFELTPEGLKRTEVADELPRKSERNRAWIYVVIIAGAVAASLFFFGRYTRSKQSAETPERSIANVASFQTQHAN
jgi:hypothetical protein